MPVRQGGPVLGLGNRRLSTRHSATAVANLAPIGQAPRARALPGPFPGSAMTRNAATRARPSRQVEAGLTPPGRCYYYLYRKTTFIFRQDHYEYLVPQSELTQ